MTRLLLFSDLHNDLAATERLVRSAADVDIVVGAGDFCQARRGISATLDILSQITTPAVLVPGNAESVEELVAAAKPWRSAHVLHGSGITIAGLQFFGLGGGIPRAIGDWSYEFTEDEASALLMDSPSGGVLVTHTPPRGVVDATVAGSRIGSTAVRALVEEKQPVLVVCGHVHNCWEQQAFIGRTAVVNAGPRGMPWSLDLGGSPSPAPHGLSHEL